MDGAWGLEKTLWDVEWGGYGGRLRDGWWDMKGVYVIGVG